MKGFHTIAAGALIGALSFVSVARADTITGTYGDVSVVGDSWQLTSSQTVGTGVGWAGIYYEVGGAITPETLTQLSADYEMTIGGFGGGAPRFTLFDASFNAAYVYWGDRDEDTGTYSDPQTGTTGNYADTSSDDIRVESNGFGGYSSTYPGLTWSDFLDKPGVSSAPISYIFLDLDGYYTQAGETQQMLVSHLRVNDKDFTPGAVVPTPSAVIGGSALFGVLGLVHMRRRAHAV